MRKITEIFVHCTATQPNWMEGRPLTEKRAEIEKWHKARGFRAIGYHYLIDRNGEIISGRPEDEIGAHVQGHNANSIGVSLIGGFGSNATDAFEHNYTNAQAQALRALLKSLKTKYPDARIRGHNEVAAKACPGFNVPAWLDNKADTITATATVTTPERTSVTQSTTIKASGLIATASAATPIVAAAGGMPWQNLAIIGLLCLSVLLASGYITSERVKKWRQGVR